jgi:hypothetical protein
MKHIDACEYRSQKVPGLGKLASLGMALLSHPNIKAIALMLISYQVRIRSVRIRSLSLRAGTLSYQDL